MNRKITKRTKLIKKGNKMRIALISPMWKVENSYPPLGLAYIGAVLEKDNHNVKIFDLTLEHKKSFENKMEEITAFSPEVVGISAMSHSYDNAIKIAEYLKNKTRAKIVLGGPHPTIMPESTLRNKFVDFVVMGEGEETFLKICQNLQTGKFHGISGLCYKENGEEDEKHEKHENIIVQPKENFIVDLDDIPFPARHLLNIENYMLVDDYGEKMATIVSSRGCPYRCTYCYKGLFGVTYRQRSFQNIVDEIKCCIEDFGYKSFYFVDDLFTMNTKRVEGLTDAIKEEKLNIRWQCLARVNNATPEMFKQMKDAGCYKVHFGIESGDQNVINKVQKAITLDQVRNATRYCKAAGIRTKGYFMLGLPGDTIETMRNTLDFANDLELDDYMFSITTPFPGTELWNSIDKSKIESLSDAFYHSCNSDEIKIFYNVSDSSNEDIMNMVRESRKITDKAGGKLFCKRRFGKTMGSLVWQMSRISPIKKVGKMLLRT